MIDWYLVSARLNVRNQFRDDDTYRNDGRRDVDKSYNGNDSDVYRVVDGRLCHARKQLVLFLRDTLVLKRYCLLKQVGSGLALLGKNPQALLDCIEPVLEDGGDLPQPSSSISVVGSFVRSGALCAVQISQPSSYIFGCADGRLESREPALQEEKFARLVHKLIFGVLAAQSRCLCGRQSVRTTRSTALTTASSTPS